MIVHEESDLVHSMIKLTHYENFVEDMKYQYSNELSHRKHPVEVFKLSPMLQFSEVMLVMKPATNLSNVLYATTAECF